eukprot:g1689.t1
MSRHKSHSLGGAMYATVDDMVRALGGAQGRPLRRVLVANAGMSAVKFIRSCRAWAYSVFGDEHAVVFIVMATPEDTESHSEYVRMGDEVVEVPGGASNNNFANVELITRICIQVNADACWPGWGHASENPALVEALTAAGVVFVGPPATPMRLLGDKIGSTIIAQSAGVSCIGWNGDSLRIQTSNLQQIPPEIYEKANVTSSAQCLAEAKRIGFPVMIKASEGGGGKGIRMVGDETGVESAYEQVQSEVRGSPIFVMKLSSGARHLEVQLIADMYGNAIALSGRDCSVQRRHQKIIEEGPPIACTQAYPNVWREMEQAAVRLAEAVGYVNAGTVEYLFKDGEFFFLELNPRLQVEHPVTEMITGVNLPATQLLVAMGIPLYNIPEIRSLYVENADEKELFPQQPSQGKNNNNDQRAINFKEKQVKPKGHCIAARITAENAEEGFQPTSGAVKELTFRASPQVWGYFSIDSNGRVHEFADSQIGHLFSWAPTREAARKSMVVALKELTIRGDIQTPVNYIGQLMETADFRSNAFDTTWLDKRIGKQANIKVEKKKKEEQEEADAELKPLHIVMLGAVCIAQQRVTAQKQDFIDSLERGQIPAPHLLQTESKVELILSGIKYSLSVERSGPDSFNIADRTINVRALRDGGFLAILGGKSYTVYLRSEPAGTRIVIDGQSSLFTKEYDPTRIVAQMAGKITRHLVAEGTHVEAGTPFCEIEVMKMIMPLAVTESGHVSFVKSEGSVIEPGDLIASVALDEPEKVRRSRPFTGSFFSQVSQESKSQSTPHGIVRDAVRTIEWALAGWGVPAGQTDAALADLDSHFLDPSLPLGEYLEIVSVLSGRIPAPLQKQFEAAADHAAASGEELRIEDFLQFTEAYCETMPSERDADTLRTTLSPLLDLARKFEGGVQGNAVRTLSQMIKGYVDTEAPFATKLPDSEVLMILRKNPKKDFQAIFRMALSHHYHARKAPIVTELLSRLCGLSRSPRSSSPSPSPSPSPSSPSPSSPSPSPSVGEDKSTAQILFDVSALGKFGVPLYAPITLKARQLLIRHQTPTMEARRQKVDQVLSTTKGPDIREKLKPLVDAQMRQLPLLLPHLTNANDPLAGVSMELYLRRIYRAYKILSLNVIAPCEVPAMMFTFEDDATTTTSAPGLKGLQSSRSFDDLTALAESGKRASSSARHGILVAFRNLQACGELLDSTLSRLPEAGSQAESANAIHIVITHAENLENVNTDLENINKIEALLARESTRKLCISRGLRRTTFVLENSNSKENNEAHAVYTLRRSLNYREDPIVRHCEPTLAYRLELERMANFDITQQSSLSFASQSIHVYVATPKQKKDSPLSKKDKAKPPKKRFFVRALVPSVERVNTKGDESFDAHPGPESIFVACLDALEVAMSGEDGVYNNHIFLNVLPAARVKPAYMQGLIRHMSKRYGDRIKRLGVAEVEFRMLALLHPGGQSEEAAVPVRLFARDATGHTLEVASYFEADGIYSAINPSRPIKGLTSAFDLQHLHGKSISTPYEVTSTIHRKRRLAQRITGTTYIYDFMRLFARAIAQTYPKNATQTVMEKKPIQSIHELVLTNNDKEVEKVARDPGQNDIGMVAWIVTLNTIETLEQGGRSIVLIGNDITHQYGSFGTREDKLFSLASRYARERKIPFVYLAANSGARIGMAEEVKPHFKVAWRDPTDLSKGFDYLYLDVSAYEKVRNSVNAKRIVVNEAEERYMITDIIGKGRDLGVENLRGSGTIAGDTSRAYDEVFTLSYVTGRCVGIGAYLVRLAQRVIQKTEGAPILLTGYQALNKLMGSPVYTSNLQLGGPGIMYSNGVSHSTVKDDFEGVKAILRWLSYVPATRGGALPIIRPAFGDSPDRSVEVVPSKDPDDPRKFIAGCTKYEVNSFQYDEVWQAGFFDRGSFSESLSGWAKTVCVGRARLGGIPVGVIATEMRTVQMIAPPDPASPSSAETVISQAGQVWFPDSAFKTAQAIRDFSREDLPLMIFANWRGFSGGQRDMFDQVLKFGALIVDALVEYDAPVFIYLPPHSTLRGGAWVVVDPTINPVMEMYADSKARGGVLETSGSVSIKFRKQQLIETAHRVDPILIELDQKLTASGADGEERKELQKKVRDRELVVGSVMLQIAEHFADLHDTPGRMLAKEAIHGVIPWKQSRSFFYWRLRRRLAEFGLRKVVREIRPDFSEKKIEDTIRTWFAKTNSSRRPQSRKISSWKQYASPTGARAGGSEVVREAPSWDDDREVLQWLDEKSTEIDDCIGDLDRKTIVDKVVELWAQNPNAVTEGVLDMISKMKDGEDKRKVIAALNMSSDMS